MCVIYVIHQTLFIFGKVVVKYFWITFRVRKIALVVFSFSTVSSVEIGLASVVPVADAILWSAKFENIVLVAVV